MATHSSILAWRSHGQRSLAGYSPWGHKELEMTVQLSMHSHIYTTFFFIFFSLMVYPRILNIVPYAIQEALVVYPS